MAVDGRRWPVEAESLWERWPVWPLLSLDRLDAPSAVQRACDGNHRTSHSGWESRDDGIWDRADGHRGNPADQTCRGGYAEMGPFSNRTWNRSRDGM